MIHERILKFDDDSMSLIKYCKQIDQNNIDCISFQISFRYSLLHAWKTYEPLL